MQIVMQRADHVLIQPGKHIMLTLTIALQVKHGGGELMCCTKFINVEGCTVYRTILDITMFR